MKNSIIAILLLNSLNSFSQDTITSDKAKGYMDKTVFLVGKVASFKLATEGSYTNYINIDKPFPNNEFTVVITNNYNEKLKVNIEDLKDKTVCIKGKISTYKNDQKKLPQIFNPISLVVLNPKKSKK